MSKNRTLLRFYIGVALTFTVVTLILPGCKASQKIEGGTAQHDTGGFVVTYVPPGGGTVVIKDDRETVATTQPSISVSGDKLQVSQQAGKGEGLLGGFTISAEDFKRTATPWVLIGVLLVLALGFYLTKQFIWCGLCVAAAVIGLIQPVILVWAVLLGVAILLYVNRRQLAQIIKGNQKALQSLDPESVKTLFASWSSAQDEKTKAVVKDLKQKMTEPIPDPVIINDPPADVTMGTASSESGGTVVTTAVVPDVNPADQ